jgi:hypothetical protein
LFWYIDRTAATTNVSPDSESTAMPERADSAIHVAGPSHRVTTLLGIAAVACYAIHAAVHLVRGEWYDLFWACHVAALLVGGGLLARSAMINSVGVLLGLMGLPLWLADLAAGGEFYPTSILTHVVALSIGLFGIIRLGMARGSWWRAALVLVGLIGFCRLATPPGPNVNVAFAIQHGWESHFASHLSYLAWMVGSATAYFFVVERILRLLISTIPKRSQSLQASVNISGTREASSR